jgi:hypothetical protein
VHNFALLQEDGVGLDEPEPVDLLGQGQHGVQADERQPEELVRGRAKREELKAVLIKSIAQ